MKSHIRGNSYLITVDTEAKTLTLISGNITTDELAKIIAPYKGYTFLYKSKEEKNGVVQGMEFEPIQVENTPIEIDHTNKEPMFGNLFWFRNDTFH